ncbi:MULTISPECIES: DNA-deoxyinosine glycosylase [unclassified Sphingomonas]|uniref:DNA-deoxyinosine glycosylase n=1 Tax=unclassified Sphingomonas TaxID=196159 RepID=UPI0006FFDB20|nr:MULTISPECIES: DNA-deoxyinosine glycosylase [unclassified Sphingomonas]KQN24007.1 DNA-deoxyinosine glycosylase [Sphingomonas sp. Leaf34]KQN24669.1 DNA-deoxyinosine glycosylase [Sphingomonas sp. Leaf38]
MPLKHSFPPVAAPDARLLVLGSLPGDRSLAAQRYYAHPQNQFWQLMSPVVGCDLTVLDYDDRLAALRVARVALWDVIGSARRAGSTDAAIADIEGNDLPALIATLPDLRAIGFNGSTALKYGRKLLGPDFADAQIVALPSSSPLHTVGLAAKLPAWTALAGFLDDRD